MGALFGADRCAAHYGRFGSKAFCRFPFCGGCAYGDHDTLAFSDRTAEYAYYDAPSHDDGPSADLNDHAYPCAPHRYADAHTHLDADLAPFSDAFSCALSREYAAWRHWAYRHPRH